MTDYEYRAAKRPVRKTSPVDFLWQPIYNRNGQAGPYAKTSTARAVIKNQKRVDQYIVDCARKMQANGKELQHGFERALDGFEYAIERSPVRSWEVCQDGL